MPCKIMPPTEVSVKHRYKIFAEFLEKLGRLVSRSLSLILLLRFRLRCTFFADALGAACVYEVQTRLPSLGFEKGTHSEQLTIGLYGSLDTNFGEQWVLLCAASQLDVHQLNDCQLNSLS